MRALAQRISKSLQPGDIIGLSGEIGAGKTFLAREIISNLLDEPEDIPSPTFALVQRYETQDMDIIHGDLYRIDSAEHVFELGFDFQEDDCLFLIEWPEKAGPFWPKQALMIAISVEEDSRIVDFSDQCNQFSERVSAWAT